MALSRRGFLGTIGTGAAAVAVARVPLADFAWAEPPRIKTTGGPLLLNSNENPYGAFPSVHKALTDAQAICNRYPWHEVERLAEQLAARHRVKQEQIVLGYGSVDILRMAGEAFCGPNKPLVQASPTFEALAMYVKRRGAEIVAVPLGADYGHDLGAMLKPARNAGLVYICNPNNPTGSITGRKQIEEFLSQLGSDGPFVLVDEAYHHFADSPDYVSFLDRPVDHPRLIVTRTFSKIYGMAGLRLGYSVSSKEIAEKLEGFSVFDSPSAPASLAGLAALADESTERAMARRVVGDRAEFMRQAAARKLHVIPSQANFVMVETGRPVKHVIEHFKQRNILIGRPFPPMDTYARISLSTPEDMQVFWKTWDAFRGDA